MPKPPHSTPSDANYYFDEDGLLVFTERYHRRRGYCCQRGCRHCPYGFNAKQRKLPR